MEPFYDKKIESAERFEKQWIGTMAIVVFIFALLFGGCSDSNPVTDASGQVQTADTMYYEIHQNYGYCDSLGCYTYDTTLVRDTVIWNKEGTFSTAVDSAWGYGQWLQYTNCYFIYEVKGNASYMIDCGGESYVASGEYGCLVMGLRAEECYNYEIRKF